MKNRVFESIKAFLKYLLFNEVKPLGLLSEAKNEWNLTEETTQKCQIDLPIKTKFWLTIKGFVERLLKNHIISICVIPIAISLHFALNLAAWMLPISLFITEKIADKISNEIM